MRAWRSVIRFAAVPSQAPRLITIPISHYCEKARWALERAGIPYREEPHLQAIHWAHVWRAGRGRTAPVLVTDDGPLTESSDILRWVDARSDLRLYPDRTSARSSGTSTTSSARTGGAGCTTAIFDRADLVREYGVTGVPRWERAVLPALPPARAAPHQPLPRRRRHDRGRVARAGAGGVRRGRRAAGRRAPLPRRRQLHRRRPDLRRARGRRARAVALRRAAAAARARCPSRSPARCGRCASTPRARFALRLYDQERP